MLRMGRSDNSFVELLLFPLFHGFHAIIQVPRLALLSHALGWGLFVCRISHNVLFESLTDKHWELMITVPRIQLSECLSCPLTLHSPTAPQQESFPLHHPQDTELLLGWVRALPPGPGADMQLEWVPPSSGLSWYFLFTILFISSCFIHLVLQSPMEIPSFSDLWNSYYEVVYCPMFVGSSKQKEGWGLNYRKQRSVSVPTSHSL